VQALFQASNLVVNWRESAIGRKMGMVVTARTPVDSEVGDAIKRTWPAGTYGAGMAAELRFVRQFLVKLRAGLSVDKCLTALIGETKNRRLRAACKEMHAQVAQGSSLSRALRRQNTFDASVVHLVETGEQAGNLKAALANVADYLERIGRLRRGMRNAVAKPLDVLSIVLFAIFIAAVALSFLVKEVMPDATATHHATVSLADHIAIKGSEVVREAWPYVGVLGALVFFALRSLPRMPRARAGLEFTSLRLPLMGTALRATVLACFFRTIGILMRTGAILGEAMAIAALTAESQFMREAIALMVQKIEKGKPYINAMVEDGFLRRRDVSAIQGAERRGELGVFILALADDHEREAFEKVGRLRAVTHTTVALLLGMAITAVLLGLYVPVFVSR
jgi:type II secretory pathway component PulF